MKLKDYIDQLNPADYYVLDTKQNGLSEKIIHGDGDINYTRYCYNTKKYNLLIPGGVFLYRQPKRSSSNGKFFFFGGGIIKTIKKTDANGSVEALIENGFRLKDPIYEDAPSLNAIKWTSKNKKTVKWSHFWNQYGMNKITKEEFLAIINSADFVKIDKDPSKEVIKEIVEENSPVDILTKKPEDFIGTYTKNGLAKETYTPTKRATKKASAKKVDFDSLNKTKKTRGTFGEVLIYNDEVIKVGAYDVVKEVEHVAFTQGDGLGYDVLSFNDKGEEVFIEVKTTTSNKIDGFYLTPKELQVAKDNRTNYKLYRVYNLDMKAGTYSVEIFDGNEIISLFDLVPVSFKATKK